MANNLHHVIPMDDGWKVRKNGAKKATKSFDNEIAAIQYARSLSKSQHSELYIHKTDGTIRSKEDYGVRLDAQKQ